MNTDLIEDAITEFRAKAKTVTHDADTYDLMADCLTRLLQEIRDPEDTVHDDGPDASD